MKKLSKVKLSAMVNSICRLASVGFQLPVFSMSKVTKAAEQVLVEGGSEEAAYAAARKVVEEIGTVVQ